MLMIDHKDLQVQPGDIVMVPEDWTDAAFHGLIYAISKVTDGPVKVSRTPGVEKPTILTRPTCTRCGFPMGEGNALALIADDADDLRETIDDLLDRVADLLDLTPEPDSRVVLDRFPIVHFSSRDACKTINALLKLRSAHARALKAVRT